MLKGIPPILSPDLLKILCEMGHGDEIVISDGNFPGAACAKRLVRADGHSVKELTEAILQVFPLDTYAPPLYAMKKVEGDCAPAPMLDYFALLAEENGAELCYYERFDFYDAAKNAYAIVQTGDRALYANLILKKGVI